MAEDAQPPRFVVSRDTAVTFGLLVAAVTAAVWITAAATNANSKIDLLTATMQPRFERVEVRIAKIEEGVTRISTDMASSQRDIMSRLSSLEAWQKTVDSTHK